MRTKVIPPKVPKVRSLHLPPIHTSPKDTQTRSTSLSPGRTACSGIHELSGRVRQLLIHQIPDSQVHSLDSDFVRIDPRRNGVIDCKQFIEVLRLSSLELSDEELKSIAKAYALDRYVLKIWWCAFLDDLRMARQNLQAFRVSPSPTPASQSHSLSPESKPRRILTIQAQEIVDALSLFFRERRIDVALAFSDFDRPGKFCKRVQRVTPSQFREVLSFCTKGLHQFLDQHVEVLVQEFSDGAGLIMYRDFVSEVDCRMEPSTGFTIRPHEGMLSPDLTRSDISFLNNSGGRNRSPSLNDSLGSPDNLTTKLIGLQPMGPTECQVPGRRENQIRDQVEDIMAKIRNMLQLYNIIMLDHMRLSDKHHEGSISVDQFRRTMDVLKVFKLSHFEMDLLVQKYQILLDWASPRFKYRDFCEDLQPSGPRVNERMDKLRKDKSITSPWAVKELSADEMSHLDIILKKLAALIQRSRIGFRQYFADFDRTTKTRSGSTAHNYTLHPGCISRSQLLQALKSLGLDAILTTEDFTTLFKRYEREGEFNQLVFIRDIEREEVVLETIKAQPRTPGQRGF